MGDKEIQSHITGCLIPIFLLLVLIFIMVCGLSDAVDDIKSKLFDIHYFQKYNREP